MPVWTLLLLVIGFLRITAGGITEARCKLHCLESVQMSNTSQSIESCESNSNCSSCLLPCSIRYKSMSSCAVSCESASNFDVCLDSCSFQKSLGQQHIGACPAWKDISWDALACFNACSSDDMCRKSQKCCFYGCGYTCQRAVIEREDYPSRPAKNDIIVEENDDALSVRIAWSLRRPLDSEELVLFVVEGRNHSGDIFRRKHTGPWSSLTMTHMKEINMPLEVGKYYQFRVAVVSINGSHGYSRPTHAITLSRNPRKPNPPENLRKGRSVLSANGKVNIVINWDAPKPSDIEITKYKLSYSERLYISPNLRSIPVTTTKVKAPDTSYELVGLELDTKYLIEVQSVAKWGSGNSVSEMKTLLIGTGNFNVGDEATALVIPHETIPVPVEDISNGTPYWFKDDLHCVVTWRKPKGYESVFDRFMVHWRPAHSSNKAETERATAETDRWSLPYHAQSAATVEGSTSFTIYNLTFDCTYLVWIVPVSKTEIVGKPAYIMMTTPTCREVTIEGIIKPACPTEVYDVPSKPRNVSHMFIIEEDNGIAVNISWQPPSPRGLPINGYLIAWTKYLPNPQHFYQYDFPVLQQRQSETVEEDCHHLVVANLEAGTRYFVMVLATNAVGGGDLAMLDITTPIFSFSVPPPNPKPPTISKEPIDDAEQRDNRGITPPSSHPSPSSSSTSPSSLSVILSCVMVIFWCTLGMTTR